jgi:2',3'-cyclic-nucleotide 2'-phosphodiesterase (5'-nucleotidase family)
VIEPATQPRDTAVAAAVEELEKKVAAQVDAVVGNAARSLDRDDLKALAERVMKERLGADFGLQNDGGVRSRIPKGRVTVRQLWEVFPFDNSLVMLKVKGANVPASMARKGSLDPEKVYTVATNTFVADHADKHLPGAEPGAEDSGIPLRDAVVEWVRKNPDLK